MIIETKTTLHETETHSLARRFARRLVPGDVVALYGELGAGKTQFVKGVCLGLGIEEIVASPSFILMNEYKRSENGVGLLSVFHFDFYRVNSLKEVFGLGIEDYFYGRGICLIEWPEIARSVLPNNRYEVFLKILENPSSREVKIEKLGEGLDEDSGH